MAEIRAFQQGRLALPFRPEPAQGVTPEMIATTCREAYENVPGGACVLTGAVDTQDNRLEVEVAAWGIVEVGRAESETTGVRGWEQKPAITAWRTVDAGTGSGGGRSSTGRSPATPAPRSRGTSWRG